MAHAIHDLRHGFWTIRGDFRIAGVLNVGTQAGLVRLGSGRFVLLDSYPLTGSVRDTVMQITDQGRAVEAVLNLHPFHTLHCATTARDFPQARLYGSARHRLRHPDLPWQDATVESPEVQEMFAADLTFSLPRGIDYISTDEHVHAGSLLAWHPASRTLHVDDTICLLRAPDILQGMFPQPKVMLHPTMPKALLRQPGAAATLEAWVNDLADLTGGLRFLCAAHSGHARYDRDGEFAALLLAAFRKMKPRLQKAEARR